MALVDNLGRVFLVFSLTRESKNVLGLPVSYGAMP